MDPDIEELTDAQSIKQSNEKIMAQILASDDGEVKFASAAGSKMIRRRIREEGFTRRIITPQTATNDMLDRALEHDKPIIIEDMEPDSPAAKSIPFGDSADIQFYYGNKFANVFNEITTPEFTKDINELRSYRMDLRQVQTDNALKDVHTEEDGQFIGMVDRIVGAHNGVGASGKQQHFKWTGGITRDNYVDALSVLEDHDLNNGVFLCNRKTAKEFLKFRRDELGGDLSEEAFKRGLPALAEGTVMGVKHIITIKRALVPDWVVYCFTEEDYLGRFFELQALTLYVKKEKNQLSFSARETLAVTIANVAGVAKIDFGGKRAAG